MINCQLLTQVFSSALMIVMGTLFVFWREVRGQIPMQYFAYQFTLVQERML
jgi:hypothetical protein